MPSTILIKRGTADPTAANVTNSGELAANTTTPKLFIKTASDSITAPIWIGATIESSPSDWTSASKLATQSAINTTFMPKSGGAFTGDVTLNAQADLRFADSDSSNWVAFQAPATVTSNVTWTLPSTDGSAGTVLSTNGSGTLSWASAGSATTVTTTSDNTNTTRYLVMSTSAQSGATLYVDDTTTALNYNPSTTVMNVGSVKLTGSGNGTVQSNSVQTLTTDQTLTMTAPGSDTAATITLTGAATPASVASIEGTTINLNGAVATTGASFELPTTFTFGDSATTVSNTLNIQTAVTASTYTKTINIGTGGASGSTTNINLGSSNGGTVTVNKDLTVSGNLTVNGTTTNINTTNLVVEDKNVILGDVTTPSDTTADGGGITLKGLSDKTFNWVDATDAWTSSEHMNLLTGKAYYINGTSVLSSSTLGSGVTASSLTSVGTITTGVWNGTDIALADGGTNASLTAVNGGVVYSTASAMAITSAGTSGQLLTSGGAGAPTWTSQSSITAGNATVAATVTLTATNTTNATHYLTFVDAATGNEDMRTDTALSYNPSTNILTAGTVEATIDGGTY